MTPLQMQVKYEDLIADLQRRDLMRKIFSTSQNRVIVYYFGSEHARDEAVRRWKKFNVEIIGEKEAKIMSLDDGIRHTIDYFSQRIQALQLEDKDMTERYGRLPDWAVRRQREIELEVKRLQEIQIVFVTHINEQVENETARKNTA